MQGAVVLVSLLVLGWTSSIQGLPLLTEPLFPTQENFDLSKFMGTWHDVAVASSCPLMKNYTSHAIGKVILWEGPSKDKVMKQRVVLSANGTCTMMSGEYELSSTPGRFFYHIERWKADVDAYVVDTNYDEYAMIVTLLQPEADGANVTAVKLISRTMAVRPKVLEDFNTLVMNQGISKDDIVYKENKGDCVPGAQVQEKSKVRRSVVPSLAPAEEEGSGADVQMSDPEDVCSLPPNAGPCVALVQRYFYNSTSMSCEVFTYGGCSGNQNNFNTEKECLQMCRSEAVCQLPMVGVACTGQLPHWAFNATAEECVTYKPGFCQTNGNKFYAKAECEEYCGVEKNEPELLAAN